MIDIPESSASSNAPPYNNSELSYYPDSSSKDKAKEVAAYRSRRGYYTYKPRLLLSKTLPNLRDLSDSSQILNPRMIYRSARLFTDSVFDVKEVLYDILKINTVVDLRESEFNRLAPNEYCSRLLVAALYKGDILIPDNLKKKFMGIKKELQEANPSEDLPAKGKRLFVCDLLGTEKCRNRIRQAVFSEPFHLPSIVIRRMGDKLWGTTNSSYYFCKHFLAERGIVESYKEIIDTCGETISYTLKLLVKAKTPILMHCSIGKDRTGIVSALFLSILEVDLEDISQDFSKTETEANPLFLEYINRYVVHNSGLSKDFCRASATDMLQLLQYIDIEYGSVWNYLDLIKFEIEWRDSLRKKFMK